MNTGSSHREHIIRANPRPTIGSRKNKRRMDIEVGKVIPTNQRDGDNMIDLSGKVAAVTGAAGGIGAEVARTLAKAGAQVVLGDVQGERGEQVAAQIREAGGQAIFMAHDTSVEDQWIAFIDTALDHFGGLDILVNNAGIEQTCFLENITVADIQKLLSVNVTGVLIGHKHAVRAMKPGGRAGKGGSIVNLSSVAGLIGTPGLGVYSASKGAVRLLTKAAAVEFGRLGYGIRVNSIHPGLVETEMGEKLLNDFVSLGMFKDRDDAYTQMKAAHPLGITGLPSDIANLALFLASDLSRWMSGAELVADGAMTVS
jgi:NAD(P)-dependent dehydrogenase (short-subunit alcohol dehydrogenase family)